MNLAEIQQFLRQKRASGRLSPQEMESAYQGYFGAEAGQADERARIELQAQRDKTARKQANRRIAMGEREYQDRADAAKIRGRMEFAKMAVPNLFMSGETGGGAQLGSTQALDSAGEGEAGAGTQAVGALGFGGEEGDMTGKSSSVAAHEFGQTARSAAPSIAAGTLKGGVVGGVPGAATALGMGLANLGVKGLQMFGRSLASKFFGEKVTPAYDIDWSSDTSLAESYADIGGAAPSPGDFAGADAGYGAGYGGTGMGGR